MSNGSDRNLARIIGFSSGILYARQRRLERQTAEHHAYTESLVEEQARQASIALDSQQKYQYSMWIQSPNGRRFSEWEPEAVRYVNEVRRANDDWVNAWLSAAKRLFGDTRRRWFDSEYIGIVGLVLFWVLSALIAVSFFVNLFFAHVHWWILNLKRDFYLLLHFGLLEVLAAVVSLSLGVALQKRADVRARKPADARATAFGFDPANPERLPSLWTDDVHSESHLCWIESVCRNAKTELPDSLPILWPISSNLHKGEPNWPEEVLKFLETRSAK